MEWISLTFLIKDAIKGLIWIFWSTSDLKFLKLNFLKHHFLLTSLFVKGTFVLADSKHESSCLIPHPPPSHLIQHQIGFVFFFNILRLSAASFSHCFISNLVLTSYLAPSLQPLNSSKQSIWHIDSALNWSSALTGSLFLSGIFCDCLFSAVQRYSKLLSNAPHIVFQSYLLLSSWAPAMLVINPTPHTLYCPNSVIFSPCNTSFPRFNPTPQHRHVLTSAQMSSTPLSLTSPSHRLPTRTFSCFLIEPSVAFIFQQNILLHCSGDFYSRTLLSQVQTPCLCKKGPYLICLLMTLSAWHSASHRLTVQ